MGVDVRKATLDEESDPPSELCILGIWKGKDRKERSVHPEHQTQRLDMGGCQQERDLWERQGVHGELGERSWAKLSQSGILKTTYTGTRTNKR